MDPDSTPGKEDRYRRSSSSQDSRPDHIHDEEGGDGQPNLTSTPPPLHSLHDVSESSISDGSDSTGERSRNLQTTGIFSPEKANGLHSENTGFDDFDDSYDIYDSDDSFDDDDINFSDEDIAAVLYGTDGVGRAEDLEAMGGMDGLGDLANMSDISGIAGISLLDDSDTDSDYSDDSDASDDVNYINYLNGVSNANINGINMNDNILDIDNSITDNGDMDDTEVSRDEDSSFAQEDEINSDDSNGSGFSDTGNTSDVSDGSDSQGSVSSEISNESNASYDSDEGTSSEASGDSEESDDGSDGSDDSDDSGSIKQNSRAYLENYRKDIREGTNRIFPSIESIFQTDGDSESLNDATNDNKIKTLLAELQIENQIKTGAENLLKIYERENKKERKLQATSELDAANNKIKSIKRQLAVLGVSQYENYQSALKTSRTFPLLKKSAESTPLNGSTQSLQTTEIQEPQPNPIWSLSDVLQSLEDSQYNNIKLLMDKSNELVSLLQRYPSLKYDISAPKVMDRIRFLVLHDHSEVAAAGYRIARYTITDMSSVRLLKHMHIDIFIIRTMTKDMKSIFERIHALKLLRAILDMPHGVNEISVGVIRAIVAVAEQSDDKLKHIALETLAEIFVQKPFFVYHGGGIRVLLQSIVEGPFELAQSITMAFTYVIEQPQNRKILRNGKDLQYLISPFTDSVSKSHASSERLQNCANVIITLIKTWPGLCIFAKDNFSYLKALVSSFQYPVPMIRETLMEIFFSIFHVKIQSWTSSYLTGKRLTTIAQTDFKAFFRAGVPLSDPEQVNSRFIDHYISLALVVFIKCGLVRNLLVVLNDQNDISNSRKAALLLVEMLNLGSRVLPTKSLTQLVSMEDLWTLPSSALSSPSPLSQLHPSLLAASEATATATVGAAGGAGANSGLHSASPDLLFARTGNNMKAMTKTLPVFPASLSSDLLETTQLDYDFRNHATMIFQISKVLRSIQTTHNNKESETMKLDSLSLKVTKDIGVQIDDIGFKQLLVDTHVLTTKSYSKWNWEALTILIQGPLLNPKRLEETIKTTKFMKRLMSFFRPFKYRFSSIKNTRPNQKCVKVGQALFNTLLQTNEGIRYLTENKLLRQIAECLAQLDPMSGITSSDPLFSSHRLENTLTSGYFSLLGTLSGDPNGMQMMERWRMFSMFYHISELRSREDLLCAFLSNMNYDLHGHPRIILSKVLTTGQKNMRLFCTSHLKNLSKSEKETQKWAIRLLSTQLFDTEMDVCRLAVEALEEFCRDSDNLEYFVSLQPSLNHIGDIGNPLLLKFLSTSHGFKYLKEIDYVHSEMDNWFFGQNDVYVGQVEEYLEGSQKMTALFHKAYGSSTTPPNPNPQQSSTAQPGSHVSHDEIPRHFYGELTQTEEGSQLLHEKGHYEKLCDFVRKHGLVAKDAGIITKLKGSLWALGHASSNPLGAPFLEETKITGDIIQVLEKSNIYSVKGTAFFVLGLISSTVEGAEILDGYGWETVMTSIDKSAGICIPRNIEAIFEVEGSGSCGTGEEISEEDMMEEAFPVFHNDIVNRAIIKAVSDLSNQILANEASKRLVQISRKYTNRFQSPAIFLEIMGLLGKYRYRLQIRKFIFEIFDSTHVLETLSRKHRDGHQKRRQGTIESSRLTFEDGAVGSRSKNSSTSSKT